VLHSVSAHESSTRTVARAKEAETEAIHIDDYDARDSPPCQ